MTREDVQSAALKASEDYDSCSVVLGTGVGKTYFALAHMKKNYKPDCMFLVVFPSLPLKKNWIDEIKKHKLDDLIPHIKFSTYRSLHKVNDEYDWVYLDECDYFKTPVHYATLHRLSAKKLAFTATYFQENTPEYANFISEFPLVYKFTTAQAVDKGILNDYRIFIHRIPLSKKINVNTYIAGFTTEEKGYQLITAAMYNAEKNNNWKSLEKLRILRVKYLQNCRSKILYIQEILKTTNKKTLVFVESISQANELCSINHHSKNSKNVNAKNLEDFCKGIVKQLSSVGQLNEGINIPDLENAVISHAYSNKRKTAQRIGRTLRLGVDSNRIANIHILIYEKTIDNDWAIGALNEFDSKKISIPKKYTESILNKLNL